MKQERGRWRVFVRRELFWLSIRIVPLIFFQLLVETMFRTGWLAFFGAEEVQLLAYDILRKLLLTLYVWFFFAMFKRYVVPTVAASLSPAVDKFVREPVVKKKTIASIGDTLLILATFL